MGSLPRAKAGVGSAMNDTTRQVGGALGVAIVASVMSSLYVDRLGRVLDGRPVPDEARSLIEDSLGGALAVAERLPAELGEQLSTVAKDAFMVGLHRGVLVAAGAALLGAVVALIWLPARGTNPEWDAKADETGGDRGDRSDAAAEQAFTPAP
jgi:hypothetical protein